MTNYLKRKRELIIELDQLNGKIGSTLGKKEKEELQEKLQSVQAEYDDVEEKSRALIQKILDKHYAAIRAVEEKHDEIRKDKITYPSVNQQLKAMRDLHNTVKELEKKIKDSKYELYDEVKANRVKAKIEKDTQEKLQ